MIELKYVLGDYIGNSLYMQLFSYTMDFLYPEGLLRIIMEMFDLSSDEVAI